MHSAFPTRSVCTDSVHVAHVGLAMSAKSEIKWEKARRLGGCIVPVSRANLRRRGRCSSPLKFLHVQARPREIKFNGVADEDLSTDAYVRKTSCTSYTRKNLPRRDRPRYAILAAVAWTHLTCTFPTNCPTTDPINPSDIEVDAKARTRVSCYYTFTRKPSEYFTTSMG